MGQGTSAVDGMEPLSVVDFGKLIRGLSEKDVVLFGDSHCEPMLRDNQLAVMNAVNKTCKRIGKRLVFGWEAFYAGTDEEKLLDDLNNSSQREEALKTLTLSYHPHLDPYQDKISKEKLTYVFKEFALPFLRFSIDSNVPIKPLGAPSMQDHSGPSDIKTWNNEMADLIMKYAKRRITVFAKVGELHLKDPPYENISIPSKIFEKSGLDIAVLVQNSLDAEQPYALREQKTSFETYSIHGRLDF